MSSYTVGCDIGGTFTDTVVIDAEGTVQQFKSPTTPNDLREGVLATLELAAHALGESLEVFLGNVARFSHGTTVGTNAVLERRGARTGLIQTKGFGDTLDIMRAGGRTDGRGEEEMHRFSRLTKPEPLVDRELVGEVAERVDLAGEVLAPLTEREARRAVQRLLDAGVESIAISLLWSFRNPVHEQLLVGIVRELAPECYVTASSDLIPRIGEYERTATTAINAYVGPVLRQSLSALDAELRGSGLASDPLLMQSHGGLASIPGSIHRAAATLLSGPAGGVVGSARLGGQLGYPNIVTTDMGGTSFDVGLIVDGHPTMLNRHLLSQYPVGLPAVGINTIGAGGGSIAKVRNGFLSVGPESAGSSPGPACLGKGGTQPTVTDANVVLGFIDPDVYLGGTLRLDRQAALAAIQDNIADPLGLTVQEAAAAIRTITDNKMADLIRRVTIERGYDPRDFVLLAYGGGGPTHAAYYGAEVGVQAIIVPITAAVHSAYGIAKSDLKITVERSELMGTPQGAERASEHLPPRRINTPFAVLVEEATDTLRDQGASEEDIMLRYVVDMRLRGQIHELAVEVAPPPLDAAQVDKLPDVFVAEYEDRFGKGSAFAAAGIELVTLRVEASANRVAQDVKLAADFESREVTAAGSRSVYLPEAHCEVELGVFDGFELESGDLLRGPVVVELPNTSVFVGTGQVARVDSARNIVIKKEESQ